MLHVVLFQKHNEDCHCSRYENSSCKDVREGDMPNDKVSQNYRGIIAARGGRRPPNLLKIYHHFCSSYMTVSE